MESKQALEGLKVLDMSQATAGPLIGKILAEHGATVIKVESSHHIDLCRLVTPYKDGVPGLERSGHFHRWNVNKLGITLNLEDPRAVSLFKKLVEWADVAIENSTPGTMAKLGLTYEELAKVNPGLVMLSTSQLGQTGPWKLFRGYGGQATAMAGINYLSGYPGQDPIGVYGAYTDLVSPPLAACALIAALLYRRRTGKGQYFDLSQLEATAHWFAPIILNYALTGREVERVGNHDLYAVPHGCYRCHGDDRWCAIAVRSDEQWQGFCQVLSDASWTRDSRFDTMMKRKRNEDELDKLVEEWTSNHSAEEVVSRLQAAGVPAAVVATAQDIYEDPQLQYREHFRLVPHAEIGSVAYESPPYRLSKTPLPDWKAAPLLGEHNQYVYKEILGLSDDEIANLLIEGVFE